MQSLKWQEIGKWWKSRQEKEQREGAATAMRQIKRPSMYKRKGIYDTMVLMNVCHFKEVASHWMAEITANDLYVGQRGT